MPRLHLDPDSDNDSFDHVNESTITSLSSDTMESNTEKREEETRPVPVLAPALPIRVLALFLPPRFAFSARDNLDNILAPRLARFDVDLSALHTIIMPYEAALLRVAVREWTRAHGIDSRVRFLHVRTRSARRFLNSSAELPRQLFMASVTRSLASLPPEQARFLLVSLERSVDGALVCAR